jgi:hypothetical protein
MSQYPSMPTPGPYIPPNQGPPAQQQQQGSQQPSPYPNTPNYGAPNQAHKSGGSFGQMMNQRLEQAVTTGKPMLNKLGKTISSKLGNKPPLGPPQHQQSYQGHQSQQGQTQGYPQPQSQPFTPQAQQQQWSQPQHQPPVQASAGYVSPQQSPYQQSNYATPASGPRDRATTSRSRRIERPTRNRICRNNPRPHRVMLQINTIKVVTEWDRCRHIKDNTGRPRPCKASLKRPINMHYNNIRNRTNILGNRWTSLGILRGL